MGQTTGFVIGNGDEPMVTVKQALDKVHSCECEPVACVLDTRDLLHYEWRPYADAFIEACPWPVVLETRGERLPETDRSKYRIYLEVADVTKLRPEDLQEGDEVKGLLHAPSEVPSLIHRLQPWAQCVPAFILPLMDDMADIRASFASFLTSEPGKVRMMLIEHRVIGID